MTQAKIMHFPWFIFVFLLLISSGMVGCQSDVDPAQLTQAVDQSVKTPIPAQVKPAPAISPTPILCTQNPPDIKLFVTVGRVSTDSPNVRFQSIQIEGQGFLPSEVVHLIIKVSGTTHTAQMDTPKYTLTKEGSISAKEAIQLDEVNMDGQVMIVHQRGVACASFIASTSTILPDSTSISAPPAATPQPSQSLTFQRPIQTSDEWNAQEYHAIFQKWTGSSSLVFPGLLTTQKLALNEYPNGHQELFEYLCEPETGERSDRMRRCLMIKYSDEQKELDPQGLSDCLVDCLKDVQTIQLKGATAYLGWAQSVSGGNWTELHWRKDGVTITIVAFGNWPAPDEANPRRLDDMVLRLAESLGQAN